MTHIIKQLNAISKICKVRPYKVCKVRPIKIVRWDLTQLVSHDCEIKTQNESVKQIHKLNGSTKQKSSCGFSWLNFK